VIPNGSSISRSSRVYGSRNPNHRRIELPIPQCVPSAVHGVSLRSVESGVWVLGRKAERLQEFILWSHFMVTEAVMLVIQSGHVDPEMVYK